MEQKVSGAAHGGEPGCRLNAKMSSQISSGSQETAAKGKDAVDGMIASIDSKRAATVIPGTEVLPANRPILPLSGILVFTTH